MVNIVEQHRLEIYAKQAECAANMAHNTGLSIVRAGLFVNAGALFAFPAFLAAFDKHELLFGWTLIISGGCYVVGLLSAALCGYYAHRNLIDMVSHWERIWGAYLEYDQGSGGNSPSEKVETLENKIDQAIKDTQPAVEKKHKLSIISGFISYIAFSVGCACMACFLHTGG